MPSLRVRRLAAVTVAGAVISAGLTASGSAALLPLIPAPADRPTPAGPSGVTARPVEPSVTQHRIAAPEAASARHVAADRGRTSVAVTRAWPVSGFAAVGVTWSRGEDLAGTVLRLRTSENGTWSGWQDLEAEDSDMPDAGTPEAAATRPGTAPLVVGDVDRVQLKVVSAGAEPPAGLSLAVIDPGTSPADATLAAPAPVAMSSSTTSTVPRPVIFSRAQWGADESLRSGTPSYGTVQTTFVHHTVNANDYAAADVPAIMRSIYAYHTQARGWSDIGYNALVDRFGRLWEGRYGGLDRNVVGAHTLYYNEESFGVSAIGNFEEVQPSMAMLDALASVLAWKLDTWGLSALGTTSVQGTTFRMINGHRDAASTACPGGYLYARLPVIRTKAAALIAAADVQPTQPVARTLRRAANADARPDVVVRQGEELRSMLGDAGPGFLAAGTGSKARRLDTVTGVGDLDGDRSGDVLVRFRDGGGFQIRGDNGNGVIARVIKNGSTRFAAATSLVGAGDLTGDGLHDLLVRMPGGAVKVATGRRPMGFNPARTISTSWSSALAVLGAGDIDADGTGDLLLIDADGVLWTVRGLGDLRFDDPVRRGGAGWDSRTEIVAGVDLTGDRRPDLMATDMSTGLTWIRPGTVAGGFGVPIGGWAGWASARMVTVTTDVSGDRFADAVVVTAKGRMSVRASRHGMWLRPGRSTTGSWSDYRYLRLVGDWDGDGKGDLVGVEDDLLWIFPGLGNGTFGSRTGGWAGWTGRSRLAAVDDWDGDGKPDLLSQTAEGNLWLHLGQGAAGVSAPVLLRAAAPRVDVVLPVGLWNRDANPDLVALVDDHLQLWPGTGTATLGTPVDLTNDVGLKRYGRLIGGGDLTGDGHPDLLAINRHTGTASILPGNVTGVGSPIRVAGGWRRYSRIG